MPQQEVPMETPMEAPMVSTDEDYGRWIPRLYIR